MKVGGIVLCGGESRRMGRPKATLPFGDETMLTRVLCRLGEAVEPLVVVAAVGQELPAVPRGVKVVRDQQPGRGPLEGLLAGLVALDHQVDAAFLTACDVPLLVPSYVQQLVSLLGENDIVIPVDGSYYQPLSAVYCTSCIQVVRRLLKQDQLRPVMLIDQVVTLRVPVDELRVSDPQLHSLVNVNDPEAYHEALRMAGISCGD